jgi:hypothetical protein
MKTNTKFALKDGGTILIETEPAAGNVAKVSRAGDIIDQGQTQLEAVLEKIKPVASAIINTLRQPVNAPTEVEVEFGIKLSAEANVIISSTAVEGNFKIVLKWK